MPDALDSLLESVPAAPPPSGDALDSLLSGMPPAPKLRAGPQIQEEETPPALPKPVSVFTRRPGTEAYVGPEGQTVDTGVKYAYPNARQEFLGWLTSPPKPVENAVREFNQFMVGPFQIEQKALVEPIAGLTSPLGAASVGAGAALGAAARGAISNRATVIAAAKGADAALSAFFATESGRQMVNEVPAAYDSYKKGDYWDALANLGSAGTSAFLGTVAALHAHGTLNDIESIGAAQRALQDRLNAEEATRVRSEAAAHRAAVARAPRLTAPEEPGSAEAPQPATPPADPLDSLISTLPKAEAAPSPTAGGPPIAEAVGAESAPTTTGRPGNLRPGAAPEAGTPTEVQPIGGAGAVPERGTPPPQSTSTLGLAGLEKAQPQEIASVQPPGNLGNIPERAPVAGIGALPTGGTQPALPQGNQPGVVPGRGPQPSATPQGQPGSQPSAGAPAAGASNVGQPQTEDIITGTVDKRLTAKGHSDARNLADRVADATSVETSPATRAEQTGEHIATEAKVPDQVNPAFAPWALGEFQGKRQSEVNDQINHYIADEPDKPVPGGESFNAAKDRTIGGVQQQIADWKPGDKPLTVLHSIGVHMIQAWTANGAPADRAISVPAMLNRQHMVATALFRLDPQTKELSPAEKIDQDGLYYARHADTEWDNLPQPGAQGVPTEVAPSPTAGPYDEDADTKGGTLKAYDPKGEKVIEEEVSPPERLADYIGKEAADKLLTQRPDSDGAVMLYNADLKVGGEKHKTLYDEKLPRFAAKYGKKWGAKVGETKIQIPPELGKETVRYTGPSYTLPGFERWLAGRRAQWQNRTAEGWASWNVSRDETADNIAKQLSNGITFPEAMEEHGNQELAEVLGGKLEVSRPLHPVTVHSLPITPAMRESVMQGQPLFALGKPAAKSGFPMSLGRTKAVYRNHVLWLNSSTMDLLFGFVGGKGSPLGLYLTPDEARRAYNIIKESGPKNAILRTIWGAQKAPLQQALTEALKENHGLVAVAYDSGQPLSLVIDTIRHEMFHAAQQALGHHFDPGRFFSENPDAAAAADRLIDRGYESDLPILWAEIGAHLAGGPKGWERMGLSREQAKDLFRRYIEDWGEPEILNLKTITPALNEVLHAARAAEAIRAEQANRAIRTILDYGGGSQSAAPAEGAGGGNLRPGVRPNLPAREQPTEPAEPEEVTPQHGIERSEDLAEAEDYRNELRQARAPLASRRGEGERGAASEILTKPAEAVGKALGIGPTFERRIKPMVTDLTKAWDQMKQAFAPGSRGPAAAVAEGAMRQGLAHLDRVTKRANRALAAFRKELGKLPQEEQWDFIRRSESNEPQATDSLQAAADVITQVNEFMRAEVDQSDPETERVWREVYWPNFWQETAHAREGRPGQPPIVPGQMRQNLAGSKGFTKQKVFPTFQDGLEAGYTPLYSNPVDFWTAKIREMGKFAMAMRLKRELAPMATFTRFGNRMPDGNGKINDPMGRVFQHSETEGGMVYRGDWTYPKPAADLINNHLSPDPRSTVAMFRVMADLGNLWLRWKLTGFFHFGTTAFNAFYSHAALAGRYAVEGKLTEAAKEMARAPISPVVDAIRGRDLMNQFLDLNGAQNAIFEAMEAGGMRAGMDPFYQTNFRQRFVEAVKAGETIGALPEGFAAASELVTAPVLEYYVPWLKMAAAADIARFELEKKGGYILTPGTEGPNPDPAKLRKVMAEAVDSVDNRFGQLTYDNLFWNRILKAVLMISVMSLGWNLGTVRELGGGVKDILANLKGLAGNGGPGFTNRIGYLIALNVAHATMAALYQKLASGKNPDNLKDLIYPRDGGVDERGTESRVSFPDYAKDEWNWMNAPGSTIVNKLHPFPSFLGRVLFLNKDYWGDQIQDKDAGYLTRLKQVAQYALTEEAAPLSVTNMQKQIERGRGVLPSAAAQFGFNPAPAYINQSPAQRMAYEYAQGHREEGGQALQGARRTQAIGRISAAIREGRDPTKDIESAMNAGLIQQRDLPRIERQAQISTLKGRVGRLSLSEALNVYATANEQEREDLQSTVMAMANHARQKPWLWTPKAANQARTLLGVEPVGVPK